jgi:cytochrome c biogenesis protein CcmG, thiol:disulfide interchange protein DsbE
METTARSRTVGSLVILSLLLLLLIAPIGHMPLVAQAATHGVGVGQSAPNFSRVDLTHRRIVLSAYLGKIVLLNFWATWCEPCLTEMPTFVEWQKQYGSRNFQVIGISMDDADPDVTATVSRLKLNYPVLMGDEHLGADYGGVLGLPVTFLIDRDGKIQARYQGMSLTRIHSDIQNLLQSHWALKGRH